MEPSVEQQHQDTLARVRVHFLWLVRLRWAAAAGHATTIAATHTVLDIPLPLGPLVSLVLLELVVNFAALVLLRSGRPLSPRWLTATLGFDVLLLTALLYFTGGPLNPFSFLYLVHLALAAIVLEPRDTWALVGLSLLCSGGLFLQHRPLPMATHLPHEAQMHLHLRGMWVALGIAATVIVHFLMRLMRAMAEQQAELAQARSLADRRERLASLATLAAGAAHELATPLSTIAVVARELGQELAKRNADAAVLEDVALIRSQLDRCRSILDRMSAAAGQGTGEGPVPTSLGELLQLAASANDLGPPLPLALRISPADAAERLRLPARATAQALRGLLKNASDASPAGATVDVATEALPHGGLRVWLRDHGQGMPKDVLARVGEPFFTTKAPGRGMGLGVFLARAVIEELRGELVLQSQAGQGTAARIDFPRDLRCRS